MVVLIVIWLREGVDSSVVKGAWCGVLWWWGCGGV